MDAADRAQEEEAAELANHLESEQRRLAAELERKGAANCADCQEPIPEERRRALPSAIRCINCQAWVERLALREAITTKGRTP